MRIVIAPNGPNASSFQRLRENWCANGGRGDALSRLATPHELADAVVDVNLALHLASHGWAYRLETKGRWGPADTPDGPSIRMSAYNVLEAMATRRAVGILLPGGSVGWSIPQAIAVHESEGFQVHLEDLHSVPIRYLRPAGHDDIIPESFEPCIEPEPPHDNVIQLHRRSP